MVERLEKQLEFRFAGEMDWENAKYRFKKDMKRITPLCLGSCIMGTVGLTALYLPQIVDYFSK
jgi:hypothetical protein